MTLFASASFFLFTALWPGSISAQYGPSTGSVSLAKTATGDSPAFTVPPSADHGMNVLPNIKDPQALDPQNVCPGYKAANVQNTDTGFTAHLQLAGPACNVYGNDIRDLTLLVKYQANDRIHLQIQPRYTGRENETWFLLPEALVPRPADGDARESGNKMAVSWSNEPSFSFTVKRRDTGDVLFTSKGKALVFEDQFLEFGSSLPDNYNLYGLGEVIHGFRLGNNLTRTIYAADVGDVVDANIYGSHPIYLDTRYFTKGSSGELTYVTDVTDKAAHYVSYTHGVFLRNAHAQEILLRPSGITWRALGGSIDLYFYAGPSAEDVTKSYQNSAVGLPAMQQYWTFGYHQCRWGYENWTVLQDVVDNFAKFEIPLETIWTDIDYMKGYRDFDNDPARYSYSEGAEFLSKLHTNHQHYVPIVDSAIYAPNPENPADAYPTYDRGVNADAFLLNPDGSIYYGAVWPGYTVFPDWVGAVLNGSGAIDWWINELTLWYRKVAFDGIWIDMSEVASFCVGSCGSGNLTLNPAHPPFELPGEPGNLVLQYPEGFELTNQTEAASASSAMHTQNHPPTATASFSSSSTTSSAYFRTTPTPGSRNVNWPPYAINNYQGDLGAHAASPNATHHGGTLEYDFHNLFGHQILNATYEALLRVFEGKRPFIIGRSTFAGSGKWAGHWGGDNEARWAFMFFSIPQALTFSIFGIPMFGVDTCGFAGNTDYELCSRWMQLSAFFPFYRNHNTLSAISQEPYIWSSVISASKTAMHIRYSLLPYMYTLFALAHRGGDTVMRALAWEFSNEPWLANADRQFMLGGAVLVTPCLTQGATTVDGVFPGVGNGTIWYDWYEMGAVTGAKPGQNVTIESPLGHIPVFLRGGHVVPIQEPGLTTTASRGNPWGLIVALDGAGRAAGKLYLDDGESLVPEATTWVDFFAKGNSVVAVPEGNYVDKNPLGTVTVLGVKAAPSKVRLNGKDLKTSYWTYSEDKQSLSLEKLGNQFSNGVWRSSWNITWH
ncbi:putative alpha-glucosidase precursor [Lasiosphaeria hispida]|uniref:alpha-glucosidase n=1 Tax=Lasiosphaeria hispida TaxID=260671 RepID=A0AAJ0HTN4_9PEZI|nr:putative alpha-glucosidase precursor [Lasiosphaeria hispida]